MITLKEFRGGDGLDVKLLDYPLHYFLDNNRQIDYDVYLKEYGINLQRPFVWNENQKMELIYSILLKRGIPPIFAIETPERIFQIIDGKQRLSTMLDFVSNKFGILIDNKYLRYNELPNDFRMVIKTFYFKMGVVFEYENERISNKEKVEWFKRLNFSGTPQNYDHFRMLNNIYNKKT